VSIRTLAVCAVLVWLAQPARALDPHARMSQYVHDAWNTNNGLPQDSVNGIAQTRDGWHASTA
jgi:ligand-binding sensor domain-containing protein